MADSKVFIEDALKNLSFNEDLVEIVAKSIVDSIDLLWDRLSLDAACLGRCELEIVETSISYFSQETRKSQ